MRKPKRVRGRFARVPWWAKAEFISHTQSIGYGVAVGMLIGVALCLYVRG